MNIENIEVFPWNESFNTGLIEIDDQHKKLVELLNQLSSHLAYHFKLSSMDDVFNELTAYAEHHFKTEEAIWQKYFIDDDWYNIHKETHASFISDVLAIKANKNDVSQNEVFEKIILFLSHWLAFHIIGSDKSMAKVVLAMQQGRSLPDAKKIAKEDFDDAIKALINSVLGMYQNISEKTLALLREISERKKVEQALLISEKKFRTLYDSTSDAVMLLDDKGFFDCNAATLKIFDCANSEEFYTKHPADLSPDKQPCGMDSRILANQNIAIAKDKGSLLFEWIFKRVRTGEIFFAEVLLNSMELNEKLVIQASVRDITKRKEMELQLQKLANTDPLTQLFNRRIFLEKLDEEIAKVKRLPNYAVVLLMLDLDFFKRINDTYDHATGDEMLKAFAEIARNNSRSIDVPARLGGEEFAILLIGANKNDALVMAERLRKKVAEIVIKHKLGLVKTTVSIGAACILADDNAKAVLHRADTALYEAKNKGRNQTCWFVADLH